MFVCTLVSRSLFMCNMPFDKQSVHYSNCKTSSLWEFKTGILSTEKASAQFCCGHQGVPRSKHDILVVLSFMKDAGRYTHRDKNQHKQLSEKMKMDGWMFARLPVSYTLTHTHTGQLFWITDHFSMTTFTTYIFATQNTFSFHHALHLSRSLSLCLGNTFPFGLLTANCYRFY